MRESREGTEKAHTSKLTDVLISLNEFKKRYLKKRLVLIYPVCRSV